jgi:hypothetical protein
MNKKGIEEFILCSCTSEGIYIKRYKNEEEVYLSIFSRGINPKIFNLKDRLRYVWNVLSKGKPFEDEVVLDKTALSKLLKVLKKL